MKNMVSSIIFLKYCVEIKCNVFILAHKMSTGQALVHVFNKSRTMKGHRKQLKVQFIRAPEEAYYSYKANRS